MCLRFKLCQCQSVAQTSSSFLIDAYKFSCLLQQNARAGRQRPTNIAQGPGRNHGFHRHFTTPGGHNVHLHVVTSVGGLPGPLESLLTNAEPADLAALLQNMQGVNLRPFSLPP